MKKKIEKFIPYALAAVRSKLADGTGKDKVYDVYDGYAASFGPAVITSGLKVAMAFYLNEKKAERGKILEAIVDILNKANGEGIANYKTVLQHTRIENSDFKEDVLAASVALKLALRNFEQVKTNNND